MTGSNADDSMYQNDYYLHTSSTYKYTYPLTIVTDFDVYIKTPVNLLSNNPFTMNGGSGKLVLEVSNGLNTSYYSSISGSVTLDGNAALAVSGTLDLNSTATLSSSSLSTITVLESGTLNVNRNITADAASTTSGNPNKIAVEKNGNLIFSSGSNLRLGINGLKAKEGSYMSISGSTISGTVDLFGTLDLNGKNSVTLLRYENTATLNTANGSTLVGNMISLKDFTLSNNFKIQGDLTAGEGKTSAVNISLEPGSSIEGKLTLLGKSSLTMDNDFSITTTIFNDESTFTYSDGHTLTGNIVNYSPNVDFDLDSGHMLTIKGALTMHDGSVNVKADTKIDDLILTEKASFDFSGGITFTGNIDNGVADIELTSGKNMTVTGNLTMRKDRTFTLGADVNIGTLILDAGSIFLNTAESIFTGNIKSSVGMELMNAVTLSSGRLEMNSNVEMDAKESLTLKNYTVSSSSIINIYKSLTLDNSKVYGAVYMYDGTSYNVDADTTIGKLVMESGSTLTYKPGITFYGGIDFYEGAKIYANGSADPGVSVLTLDTDTNLTIAAVTEPGTGKVIPAQLIMESGTTLNLNTDVTIGTIVLKNGTEFNYGDITITGNLDNYRSDIVLDEGYNLKITGSLIMEEGTKLTLNVNPDIGNLVLMKGSEFEYKPGVERVGSFESYADLVFKADIHFKGNSKDRSFTLHSYNGVIVDPDTILTFTDVDIIVNAIGKIELAEGHGRL